MKHVIVLSDGRSMESGTLPGIARAMNEEGINVSTISVGDQSDDETMSAIAPKVGAGSMPSTTRIYCRGSF